MVLANPTGTWTAADGAALYGLERWGDPYFCVSERGHVMVQPRGDRGGSLDLVELVEELQGQQQVGHQTHHRHPRGLMEISSPSSTRATSAERWFLASASGTEMAAPRLLA
jgi:hypothetical protein